MLDDGVAAVAVLTEYVRACRQLGHDGPDPVALQTVYTAEESMDLEALAADCRSLTAAVAAAEEAQSVQDDACRAAVTAWQGAGGAVAADFLHRHAAASAAAVDGLRCAATALQQLADRLGYLVEAKVETTVAVEGRGVREVWLEASRTVSTGAGDRSNASELVDLQVAPFVADDVGGDWMASMRATGDAIRQAYRSAADAAFSEVVFDSPGRLAVAQPTAGQAFPRSPAATVPTGYITEPTAPPASAPPVAPSASAPAVPPAAVPDPLAAAAPPMTGGGLGGMPSPVSGLSGLSGLGQPFTDLLSGLFGSRSSELSDGSVDLGDPLDEDVLAEDSGEGGEDADADIEESDTDAETEAAEDTEQDAEEDAAVTDDEESEDVSVGEQVPLGAAEAAPVPTPVPEPLPPPPAEPVPPPAPAATPCEIAADALPQAGP
ncbi:hypothetical protein [Mycolicibacterium bacteremicum]|uniref:Uncharacterized protein n=1 Tax=Mycolicibacterium bacteremicum TaxID=564198 RepID=A0A1W9Z3D0_MYCBA|nr:hypothetical protein [Mycolicibacterium bacteremicum]MCV7431701.1 hypothetical protein [Mycolicibacterium bacteremicum]ORA06821.1 hypothetical protein BST17_04095 [Mycolicibacterium bacteremicum]